MSKKLLCRWNIPYDVSEGDAANRSNTDSEIAPVVVKNKRINKGRDITI